jgi:hypothetical protein
MVFRANAQTNAPASAPATPAPATAPVARNLTEVRRVYVGDLVGAQASALRELIIASLQDTKLFILTDNPDRADAVMKGAADDEAYVDTFDSDQSVNGRQSAGRYSAGSTNMSRLGGYSGLGAGESESHHIKEHKHRAYAAVRLCNRDGDVLWSTTQESGGAKFRSASADVAAKVAHQLTFDLTRPQSNGAAPSASAVTK